MYGLPRANCLGLEWSYMNRLNTIGVDLAKDIIQVSVVSPSNKELQNKTLTR